MTQLPEITEDAFDASVLGRPEVSMIMFTNDGCGLCKIIAPALAQIADEYEGEVQVAYVDTEHSPAIAARYNIQSVPQLFLFANGELRGKLLGLQSRGKMAELIEANLTGAAK